MIAFVVALYWLAFCVVCLVAFVVAQAIEEHYEKANPRISTVDITRSSLPRGSHVSAHSGERVLRAVGSATPEFPESLRSHSRPATVSAARSPNGSTLDKGAA